VSYEIAEGYDVEHTPSWLTLDELNVVLAALDMSKQDKYFVAIIFAMKTIETLGDVKTRLVFWFDN
jgi:hypothetical protein